MSTVSEVLWKNDRLYEIKLLECFDEYEEDKNAIRKSNKY